MIAVLFLAIKSLTFDNVVFTLSANCFTLSDTSTILDANPPVSMVGISIAAPPPPPTAPVSPAPELAPVLSAN